MSTYNFLVVVHEQVLLPFRTRFGIVAKQHVIEAETQQLLRSQQRHTCLFRRSVPFPLVAFHAGGDQVRRGAFAALCTRQNVIERQVLCVFMVAAILAAVTVANVNPGTLHRRFAAVAANVHVMPQTDHRREPESRRRRMEDIVAVVLFDEYRAAKPQTHRSGDTDRTQRLIRKIQK